MDKLKRISTRLIKSVKTLEFKRTFFEKLESPPTVISILRGARGVGKTTTLLQFLAKQEEEGQKCLYLSADHTLLADRSLFEIAESFYDEGGNILALDEIHKAESWNKQLKSAYDSLPGLKIVASGSSSLKMDKADLSRRAIKIACMGLSFREWCELHLNLKIPKLDFQDILENKEGMTLSIIEKFRERKESVLQRFDQYLAKGYFPTSFEIEDDFIYYETLREAIAKTLSEDILCIYPDLSGRSISKLRKILSIISSSCPYQPDLTKLKLALEMADNVSVKNYLYLLDEANIIKTIASQGKSIRSLVKPDKIYLDNTNYLFALASQSPNIGTVRETFVALTLSQGGSQLYSSESVFIPKKGDFVTSKGELFEVGGPSKKFSQIAGKPNSWIIASGIEHGSKGKIPMWLLGLLW